MNLLVFVFFVSLSLVNNTLKMKKFFMLCSAIVMSMAASLALTAQNDYPSTAKDVALAYAKAFYTGDKAAAQYVNFNGINVIDMATTPAALQDNQFQEELAKHKGKKPTVSVVGTNPGDFDDQIYAVCKVSGKEVYLLLTPVEGKWKVDFSAWYFNEYYDGY